MGRPVRDVETRGRESPVRSSRGREHTRLFVVREEVLSSRPYRSTPRPPFSSFSLVLDTGYRLGLRRTNERKKKDKKRHFLDFNEVTVLGDSSPWSERLPGLCRHICRLTTGLLRRNDHSVLGSRGRPVVHPPPPPPDPVPLRYLSVTCTLTPRLLLFIKFWTTHRGCVLRRDVGKNVVAVSG